MMVKSDCIAFGVNKGCSILINTDCDKCKFYKTKSQLKDEVTKSTDRIERLRICSECKFAQKLSEVSDKNVDFRDCPRAKTCRKIKVRRKGGGV